MESLEEERMGLEREIDELEARENRPVRIKLTSILQWALLIVGFLLLCLLVFFVLYNINLLSTDPCRLCEKAGNICARSFG
mgnify:CR=1 FL=1